MIQQRQIVEVIFNDEIGNHPVIVLSNNLIHEVEDAFVGVMMTTANYDDEFSFFLNDSMILNGGLAANSQVRIHLINYFPISNVISNNNRASLTLDAFNLLKDHIYSVSFSTMDLS